MGAVGGSVGAGGAGGSTHGCRQELVRDGGFAVLRRVFVDFGGLSLKRKFLGGLEPEAVHMLIGEGHAWVGGAPMGGRAPLGVGGNPWMGVAPMGGCREGSGRELGAHMGAGGEVSQ